ncbi:hypothetical protein MPER_04654 [Moniliophthora perniciosa FA553]|nr:hypothetical protein MPER_04654 [Moniliophthora perniciosa FA553]
MLDLWIPATNIGLTNLNDGVLGIFGLITSLMAAHAQWEAVNRKYADTQLDSRRGL